MNKEEMKRKILEYCEKRIGVSFAELEMLLGDAMKGTYVWYANKDELGEVYLWVELSKEFIECMRELISEGKIYMRPTHFLVYLADGKMLSLPIAKRKYKYKTPHWLPIVFNHVKYLKNESKKMQEIIKKVQFKQGNFA